jgi:hypothetical protein
MADDNLRDILRQIAELAQSAASPDEDVDYEEPTNGKATKGIVCTPKSLPKSLLERAAKTALEENPVNAPMLAQLGDLELTPLDIAVLTSKYWGAARRRLTVSFMETTPADLRRRILSHMNAWNRTVGITFAETAGVGQIRISRGSGGYYSYLGTDCLHIPRSRQTMNLQGFTMSTSEAEFTRVVRHETGHTLGAHHEHMRRAIVARIDREKAYRYFGGPPNNWSRQTVDQQVLTPLEERSLMATPADQTSIMCYQLPGSITRDGRPILGGRDITANDYAFMGRIYPKTGAAPRNRLASEQAEETDTEDEFLDEPEMVD